MRLHLGSPGWVRSLCIRPISLLRSFVYTPFPQIRCEFSLLIRGRMMCPILQCASSIMSSSPFRSLISPLRLSTGFPRTSICRASARCMCAWLRHIRVECFWGGLPNEVRAARGLFVARCGDVEAKRLCGARPAKKGATTCEEAKKVQIARRYDVPVADARVFIVCGMRAFQRVSLRARCMARRVGSRGYRARCTAIGGRIGGGGRCMRVAGEWKWARVIGTDTFTSCARAVIGRHGGRQRRKWRCRPARRGLW